MSDRGVTVTADPVALMRPVEAACVLERSVSTVYAMCRRHELVWVMLPPRNAIRIPAFAVETYLASQAVAAAEQITADAGSGVR